MNFLREKILQEFGDQGCKQAEELFKEGTIDSELDDLSTARSKPELFACLNLYSLPVLRRLLEGKSARMGDAEAMAMTSEALLSQFKAFKEGVEEEALDFTKQIDQIQGERQGECLKALAKAQAAQETGKKLIAEKFMHTGMQVVKPEQLPAASVCLQRFVGKCAAEATPSTAGAQMIPIVSLWCIKCGGAADVYQKGSRMAVRG